MLKNEFNLTTPLKLINFVRGLKNDAATALQNAFQEGGTDHDAIVVDLAFRKAHVIREPEMVAEGVRAHRIFQKSPEFQKLFSFFGHSGVFTSPLEEWDQQRAVLARALANGNLSKYEDVISAEVDALVDKFSKDASSDLYEDFKDFAVTTFFKAILNYDITADRDAVKEHVDNLNTYFPKKALTPMAVLFKHYGSPSERFQNALDFLDRLMHDIHRPHMAQYREGETVSEILKSSGYYDATTDTARDEAKRKSFEQVTHLFVAGYESTAASMTWLLYRLGNNPDIQNAVCAEVAAAQDDDAIGGMTAKNYRKFGYLQKTIAEAVRINPTLYLSVPRKATEDYTFKSGYKIKKGEYFLVPIHAVNNDARSHPQPQVFAPEREEPQAPKQVRRETNMSFYAGAHGCTGKSLFMFEASLLTARILEKLEIQPAKMPGVISKTSMTPQKGFGITFAKRTEWPPAHAPQPVDAPANDRKATSGCPFHRMLKL